MIVPCPTPSQQASLSTYLLKFISRENRFTQYIIDPPGLGVQSASIRCVSVLRTELSQHRAGLFGPHLEKREISKKAMWCGQSFNVYLQLPLSKRTQNSTNIQK